MSHNVSIVDPMQGNYRKDIDGLRGVAVLSVFFFHAKLAEFSGGFVGVDVFFVISGFLITGIITGEVDRGTFSFLRFYQRRIRRILPALLVVSLATTVVAGLVFPPLAFLEFARSLLAVIALRNSYFIKTAASQGYFADNQDPLPMLHTWSLVVEEQFYLLFPLGLLFLLRFFRSSKTHLLFGSLLLSFTWSVWFTHQRPVWAFYLLQSRIWELLLGAFLVIADLPAIPRFVREVAALFGLSAILFAVHQYTGRTPFPGENALLPCLGTALILCAGKYGGSLINTALSFPPLVMVGLISYSLYLWHWPMIVFHRYIFSWTIHYHPSSLAIFLLLLASISVATLSYFFIERPFRGASSRFNDRQVFGYAVASFAMLVGIGLIISKFQGLPGRFDPMTLQLLVQNSNRPSDWVFSGKCDNFRLNTRNFSDATFCDIQHSSKNILFWGDSHVQQLYPLIESLEHEGKLNGRGAVFASSGGCPPMERTNLADDRYYCDAFTRVARQRAFQDDIDTVFLESSLWWSSPGTLCVVQDDHCGPALSYREEVDSMMGELSVRVRQLRSAGKRVIIGLPFPTYEDDVPHYEILRANLGRFMNIPPPRLRPPILRAEFENIARQEGAEVYDPRLSLCHGGVCTYAIDNVSIYMDGDHIAASQTGILKDQVLEILNR